MSHQRIALASAFSPRFLPLLAEAKAFSERLGAGFSVIYVGRYGQEEKDKFAGAFESLGLPRAPEVFPGQGEPAAAILQAAAEHGVDLIIAGAMEHETGSRNFLGDVARTLLRDAPLSLLLIPHPSQEPRPFRRIAVIVDFSDLARTALLQAIHLAERHNAEVIHVIRIFTIFSQALADPAEFFKGAESKHRTIRDEEAQLEEFISSAGRGATPIEARCIEGTTGFAASDYVQGVDADLLIVPLRAPGATDPTPQGADWVFNVIPTTLLVVRE